jgi:hypothetical protein
MATLLIQHAITDFDTWKGAFNRFAAAREQAGVRRHLIRRPVDDANFVVIDLEFDTTAEAEKFLGFLKTNVWSSRESSPGLAGTPQTNILETADPG